VTDRPTDRPHLPPVDPRAVDVSPDVITPEALAAFLVDGDAELAAWGLGVALGDRPRVDVYDTLVRDAMTLVGRNWETGRWTISEEHLGTVTLIRVLAELAPSPMPGDRIGPVAVLASVVGEEHAIALTLLDHVLRDVGWSVADLGANVPPDDLVRYVARSGARLVALTAARTDRIDEVTTAIAGLRAIPSPPSIMVGGRAVDAARGAGLDIGADWTGTSLRDARRFAHELLGRISGNPPAS
jgi:methanogenic corrinoid protein MtbC1